VEAAAAARALLPRRRRSFEWREREKKTEMNGTQKKMIIVEILVFIQNSSLPLLSLSLNLKEKKKRP
jgi:hypothetical protein